MKGKLVLGTFLIVVGFILAVVALVIIAIPLAITGIQRGESTIHEAEGAPVVFISLILKTVIPPVDCAKRFTTGPSGEKESGIGSTDADHRTNLS